MQHLQLQNGFTCKQPLIHSQQLLREVSRLANVLHIGLLFSYTAVVKLLAAVCFLQHLCIKNAPFDRQY